MIPEDGGLPGRQELREGEEEGEEGTPRRWWPFFRVFLENKYLRLFFRQVESLPRSPSSS